MSIYFQYPAIDEYPALAQPPKATQNETPLQPDEDEINTEQILALKDFLTLKPV